MNRNFLSTLQCYIATTAIGPSSLRNQGNAGVIDAARNFLSHISLKDFCCSNVGDFKSTLDKKTEELKLSLPTNAQNWGAARKAMNLFLRNAFYNRYLSDSFHLAEIEYLLEIPLDSMVAKGLKILEGGSSLPDWPGLKNLYIAKSEQFQSFALSSAKRMRIARVHLDMYLWLKGKAKTNKMLVSV